MSFMMTHLAVAKGVNDKLGIVTDLPNYYLGALAPDAVHIRANFNSDMKESSHYCVAGDTWGQIASVDAWWQQSFTHIKSLKDSPDRDFYLGYFIHILTDTSNHRKMWLPFLEKRLAEGLLFADAKDLVSEDYNRIDRMQYDNYEWQNEIMSLLEIAKGIDVEDIVKACEIDKYTDILLKIYRQNIPTIEFMDLINGKKSSSVAERKLPVYVSEEEIFGFIEETVKEICLDILRL